MTFQVFLGVPCFGVSARRLKTARAVFSVVVCWIFGNLICTELPKLGRFISSDSVLASPSPGAAPETGAPGPQGKAVGIRKESRACLGFAGVLSPAWSALVPPTQRVGGHRVVRAFTWGGQPTGYQPKGPFPCKAWKGILLA